MQDDTLIGGQILSTVTNRFYDDHRCDGIFIMPTTHVTTKEMIETGRTCLNINSADVFSAPRIVSSLINGSSTVVNAIKLAVEKHEVKHVVLFRHQGMDDGKILFEQKHRVEEDKIRKIGLVKARDRILQLHPAINVVMIYAKFINRGRQILLRQIAPNLHETTRMLAENRFMSADGAEIPCEGTVITCMDYRQFREVRTCVQDVFKVDRCGIIGLPGSGKRFIEGGNVSWQGFDQAVGKHRSKKFYIFHHSDCGAYGGLPSFNEEDVVVEELMHRKEMEKLRAMILKRKPGVEVELVFARFIEQGQRIRFVRFD